MSFLPVRMNWSIQVSPAYIPALQRALFWQALVFCLSALILDFFYTNHIVVVAAAGHWLAIAMVLVRRPNLPTSVDLFFCRAYPLVFAITMVLAPIVMGGFMGQFRYRTLLDRWFGFDLLHDFEFFHPLVLIPAVIWLLFYPFLGRLKRKAKRTEPVSKEEFEQKK